MNHRTADQTQRVVVIGAGLGGLAAACTLAARGYRVTLADKNPWLGGKAAVLDEAGYRFDMGPTILTMPKVLRRVFDEAGVDMNDRLDLRRLDPQWRCFFDGGHVLDLHEQTDAMRAELGRFASVTQDTPATDLPEKYRQFIDYTKQLHDISERFFFWKPIGGLGDMFDWKASFDPKMLRDVLSMGMGRSVAKTIRQYVPDARVAQMLDHFTQYVGSSPYGSPTILCGIAHMQTDEGVWYPIGGTRAVPEALTQLATELGVELRTQCDIARINVRKAEVYGVETTTGESIPCAAVVSNMDSIRTHRELLNGDGQRFLKRHRGAEPACSGVVLYLGLNRRYEQLAHHDFVFSHDPHEEFDYIYNKGEPAPDPTCYLAVPTNTEAPGRVAPEGGEALYILVHTPYLRDHHNWSKILPEYRKVILDKLERTAGMEGLEDAIVTERSLTPQDIHDRYRVLNGAIYGLASHGTFLGGFKPGNRSKDIKGLYLAGGAAHPGPGMPMVLMSGWIAADTLDSDGMVEKAGAMAHPGV